MDAFTENHLHKWIERTVHESEQHEVHLAIREMVRDYPELVEQGYSWSEIRMLAERRGEKS